MNTPKKAKRWQDRTSGADRTRKSKPYHGPRNFNYTLTPNLGEHMSPGHEKRQITARDLQVQYVNGFFVNAPKGHTHDQACETPHAYQREEFSRSTWRDRTRPWRKKKPEVS